MSVKVILVTGASSGIGEATALRLREQGHTVYAAARRTDRMRHLESSGIRNLAMDVTDDASMQSGIATIIAQQGRLDVLVNNAGYGSYGAIEDVAMEEARAQFDVNVFGAVRLIQLAAYARSKFGLDHQHHLDGWQDSYSARRLVSWHQICSRGDQRLPAD
jgi:NAD(P)-dependent dehydrogenase (short-subunit alcohol dehydrogenase family)